MNGFTWLLLSFPVYLLAKGRFVDYVKIASGGNGSAAPTSVGTRPKGLGGLNNNQAVA